MKNNTYIIRIQHYTNLVYSVEEKQKTYHIDVQQAPQWEPILG